jgi:uncharacterized protein YaaR (DUF327 family)
LKVIAEVVLANVDRRAADLKEERKVSDAKSLKSVIKEGIRVIIEGISVIQEAKSVN